MVLMYCYGSSFHANRFRLASSAGSAFTQAAITEKVNQAAAMELKLELVLHCCQKSCQLFPCFEDFCVT
jgi:hypothetical protein